MEAAVKTFLKTKTLKDTGVHASGCISSGGIFSTDTGQVFIKVNHKSKAKEMFTGELAGLERIISTKTIRVPTPIGVIPFGSSSCALVLESVKMKPLNNKLQGVLGEQLARMHLHNSQLLEKQSQRDGSRVQASSREHDDDDDLEGGEEEQKIIPVTKFGFHVPTSCGYILQRNTWEDDWTTFYIRHKLQFQVDELLRTKSDRELQDLWTQCLKKVEVVLGKVKPIPSLLHGDLWSGNASAVDNEPILYDPAAFYGHSEYDLGIANMFGGFGPNFYDSYHNVIPKTDGFDQRVVIYELFHHLNHWNHFGSGYRNSALRLMREISSF